MTHPDAPHATGPERSTPPASAGDQDPAGESTGGAAASGETTALPRRRRQGTTRVVASVKGGGTATSSESVRREVEAVLDKLGLPARSADAALAAARPRRRGVLLALWIIVGVVVGGVLEYKFSLLSRLRGDELPGPRPAVDYRQDPVQLNLFDTSEALAAAIDFASESVVSIQAVRDGVRRRELQMLGSGIVFRVDDHEAWIITNDHVVADAGSIRVTYKEYTVEAREAGRDPATDLSILMVRLADLPVRPVAAVLADSDLVRPGHLVVAIGQPSGYRNSATLGIISAVGRSGPQLDSGYADDLQTSAPINRGNSGGPLVNVQGRVVGINTWKVAESEGLGFAIPSNLVRRVATDLIERGEVRRAALGVRIRPLDEAAVAQFGPGVWVSEVLPHTPAENAGVTTNDIIFALNDKPVHTVRQLKTLIAHHYPGDHVTLVVLRSGRELTIPVVLGLAQ